MLNLMDRNAADRLISDTSPPESSGVSIDVDFDAFVPSHGGSGKTVAAGGTNTPAGRTSGYKGNGYGGTNTPAGGTTGHDGSNAPANGNGGTSGTGGSSTANPRAVSAFAPSDGFVVDGGTNGPQPSQLQSTPVPRRLMDPLLHPSYVNVDAHEYAELNRELSLLRNQLRTLSMNRSPGVQTNARSATPRVVSSTDETVVLNTALLDLPLPRSAASYLEEGGENDNGVNNTDACVPAVANQSRAHSGKTERVYFPDAAHSVGRGIVAGGYTTPQRQGPALEPLARIKGDRENGDTSTTGATTGASGRAARKPIKLERFDGVKTPLEVFVAKFVNCQRYNGWTNEESVAFLRDSLTGSASQVLWEISDDATHTEIIDLLRNRFGNANQTERYRAELASRRRKKGESTQAVYQDIKRLLALGFPGQCGEMYEVIGRDAFLTAIGDKNIRTRVLDQQPKTLDETLAIVVRMESYSGEDRDGEGDAADRKRVRIVSPARETDADRRIRKLEEEIKRLKGAAVGSMYGSDTGGSSTQAGVGHSGPRGKQPDSGMRDTPTVGAQGFPPQPYVGQQRTPTNNYGPGSHNTARRKGNQTVPRDMCKRCGQRGHWQIHCTAQTPGGSGNQGGYPTTPTGVNLNGGPEYMCYPPPGQTYDVPGFAPPPVVVGGATYYAAPAQTGGYYNPPTQTASGTSRRPYPYRPPANAVNVSDGKPAPPNDVRKLADGGCSEAYIELIMRGRKVQALLDTGCERSVCPLRLCKHADITPVQLQLSAANNTVIEVVGTARLHFKVQGVKMFVDVYVTEAVDELILGVEFLKENKCQWLFTENQVILNGTSIPVCGRLPRNTVRRVYVREPIIVPTDTSVDVPVRLPLVNLRTPKVDWLAESKEVKTGLLAARTLLPHNDKYAAIRFINVSGTDQTLKKG